MKREGTMWLYETSLNVWEEHVDAAGMLPVFSAVIDRLEGRGFAVRQDPHVLERWPTLAETHWVGIKGHLEFKVELTGRHLKLEFFQNLVSGGNRSGDRYDFGKYRLMPHWMRLQFIVEMTVALRLLESVGYKFVVCGHHGEPLAVSCLNVRDRAAHARHDSPLDEFNSHWGKKRFDRDETGWPTVKVLSSWRSPDRDGVPVRTGDTRYLRIGGRLQRCAVWPNMNGMWQARFGGRVRYVSSRELFTCERPDLEPRRLMPGQIERLEKELRKALDGKDYRRVEALGRAIARVAGQTARAA